MRFLAWIALGLGLALTWAQTQKSPPLDLGHQIALGYTGVSEQAFDHHGLLALGAGWTIVSHPSSPERTLRYVNHPALSLLLLRPLYLAFGRTYRGLQYGMLLGWFLALAGVAWRVGLVDRKIAAVTVLLMATCPGVRFATLACPPFFGLPFWLLSLAIWASWRRSTGPWSYGAYAVVSLLASLSDWNSYGVPAVLSLFALGAPAGRKWSEACRAISPWVAGLLLNLGHGVWVLGGVPAYLAQLENIQRSLGPFGMDTLECLTQFGRFMIDNAGAIVPVAALAAVSSLRQVRGAGQGRIVVELLLAGAIPCALFWSRTVTHDFWPFLLVPGLSAFVSVKAAGWKSRSLAMGIIAAGVGLNLAWTTWEFQRDSSRHFERRAESITRLGGAGDVCVFPDYGSAFGARFFAQRTVIPQVQDRARLIDALDLLAKGGGPISRVWMCLPAELVPEFPWFASLPYVPGTLGQVPWDQGSQLFVGELDVPAFRRSGL